LDNEDSPNSVIQHSFHSQIFFAEDVVILIKDLFEKREIEYCFTIAHEMAQKTFL
jgi:hypothetical protein